MTKITIEQQLMLEQLTGQHYTRNGLPRKKPRSYRQTLNLGGIIAINQLEQELKQLADEIKAQNERSNKLGLIRMKETIYKNKLEEYQRLVMEHSKQGKIL